VGPKAVRARETEREQGRVWEEESGEKEKENRAEGGRATSSLFSSQSRVSGERYCVMY
jgi:hypothetical protein